MALAGPAKGTFFCADWGNNHLMCLVDNHASLLLRFAFVARTLVILVQPAFRVGARTLELEQFTLTDPQYCEQALYTRTVRLEGLSLFGRHVRRHSLYFL